MSRTTGGIKQRLHLYIDRPVVLEHAQKYTTFQNKLADFVRWLKTSGIFLTYKISKNKFKKKKKTKGL